MSNKLVLVLNCGSSSIKFSIINPNNGKKHLYGIAEKLLIEKPIIKWKINKISFQENLKHQISYKKAIRLIVKIIAKNKLSNKICAIGHRIVHGGGEFFKSVLINSKVLKCIKQSIPFAPLHNPIHLTCIKEIFKQLPHLIKKNVAVFDTAFYQNIPKHAYLYALPYYLYTKYKIRRYGAHGISHYYAMKQTALFLNKKKKYLNIITCHLGNGSSISAIKNGICVDTSMGLTPLEGLVMGTRSGDIDPSIIFFLYHNTSLSIKKIDNMLNKQSGLLGLTETTNDFRDIEKYYKKKENYKIALNVYVHRLVKYIGGYSCLMNNKLDAIVFTGGIGENSVILRKKVLDKLLLLGFKIDNQKNMQIHSGKSGFIHALDSKSILVIKSNEEIIIARDTDNLTNDDIKK